MCKIYRGNLVATMLNIVLVQNQMSSTTFSEMSVNSMNACINRILKPPRGVVTRVLNARSAVGYTETHWRVGDVV